MKKNNISIHLNNLYKHCQLLIENRNIDELNNNLELFEVILLEILNGSKSPQSSKILKETINICDNVFADMIKKDFVMEAFIVMKRYYQSINKADNKISIEFSNALTNFLKYVKEERSVVKLSDLPILPLFDEILGNTYLIDGKFYGNGLVHYLSSYYLNLYKNTFLSNEDKNQLIENTYRHLLIWPIYTICKEDPDRLNLINKVIEKLLIKSVLLIDNKNFGYFIQKLINESYYAGKSININEISIKISVYLYYLIEKEDLIKSTHKQGIKELLESNSKLLINQLFNIYDLWNHYQKVKNDMSNWEHFDSEGEAKFLIMDYVVNEFFYFADTALTGFDIDKISDQILNEDEMFLFFEHYTFKGELSETTINAYLNFKKLFNLNIGKEQEELSTLNTALMGRYKKFLFKKKREIIESVSLEDYKNVLLKNLNTLFTENKYVKSLPTKKVLSKNLENINILTLSHTIEFLQSNVKSVVKLIDESLNKHIKTALVSKGLKLNKINFSTINKLTELKKLLFTGSEESLTINNLIYGIDENSTFLYSETEKMKLEYKSILEKIPFKQKVNKMEWIGLNNEYVSLRFSDWNVEVTYYSDVQIEKILEKCKEGNDYFINITNNIHLKFDEDEAKEYLRIENAIIRTSIFIEVNIDDKNNAGFILEVK